MDFNISAWSIRRPVPSLVLFMVLIAVGILSFRSLPITRFPNIDIPVIQAQITQAGAAPAELETQVTKRVEDGIAGITGVKHQTSTLTEGSSVTMVEFRLEASPNWPEIKKGDLWPMDFPEVLCRFKVVTNADFEHDALYCRRVTVKLLFVPPK